MIEMLTGKTVGYLCAMNNVSIKTNVVRVSSAHCIPPTRGKKKSAFFYSSLQWIFFLNYELISAKLATEAWETRGSKQDAAHHFVVLPYSVCIAWSIKSHILII